MSEKLSFFLRAMATSIEDEWKRHAIPIMNGPGALDAIWNSCAIAGDEEIELKIQKVMERRSRIR